MLFVRYSHIIFTPFATLRTTKGKSLACSVSQLLRVRSRAGCASLHSKRMRQHGLDAFEYEALTYLVIRGSLVI